MKRLKNEKSGYLMMKYMTTILRRKTELTNVSLGPLSISRSRCCAIIREVREETGLTIHSPVMTGTYQWYKGKVRNVLLLYKVNDFSGELTISDEGKVYWMPLEEFRTKQLAEGMLDVLEIMETDKSEFVRSYGED
ncbi:MAG: NUDIX domain-containing protein [Bacillota bacterium]|nr:NUDIX domain-containing protein [Bacillota bacterium]